MRRRLLAALLFLYPRERRAYSDEMLAMIDARHRRAVSEGRLVHFWFALARDTATALPAAWWRVLRAGVAGAIAAGSRDLAGGIRALARRPAVSVVAVATLALGIGASTALFSLVDAVLLRPLPYADSERLVTLWNRTPEDGVEKDWFAPAHFDFLRGRLRTLESLTLLSAGSVGASLGDGSAERFNVIQATPGFMNLIGARPLLGRTLRESDGADGADRVAMLTHDAWRSRFGGDPEVVGRVLHAGDVAIEIVGVLPPTIPLRPEILSTVGQVGSIDMVLNRPESAAFLANDSGWNYNLLAHRANGVSLEQIGADLDALLPAFRERFDVAAPSFSMYAVGLLEDLVSPSRPAITALFVASALIMLITCGNVATLLLAQGERRLAEFGMRRALGAGRGRLMLQLLAESLAMALTAASLGLLVAHAGLGVLRRLPIDDIPRIRDVAIDPRALGFALASAFVTTIIVGFLPAWRAGRIAPGTAMSTAGVRVSARGAGLRPRVTTGGCVVTAQIALSTVVLFGAGLVLRSYAAVRATDPGFATSGVLTLRMSLGAQGAEPAARWPLVRDLVAELAGIPGVRAAGVSNQIPLGSSIAWGGAVVEGRDEEIVAELRTVTPGYFEAMGIDIVEGATFADVDVANRTPVIIVDRALREAYWPGQPAVGREASMQGDLNSSLGIDADMLRVVGVAESVRQYRLDEPSPRVFLYYPYSLFPTSSFYVVLRTSVEPAIVADAARRAISAAVPGASIGAVQPVDDLMDASLAQRRFAAALIGIFALIAAALSLMGTYALLAFRIAAAQRELGLRVALGADRGRVIGMVLRHSIVLALAGTVVGLPAGVAAGGLLRAQLYGVTPLDGPTMLGATAAMVLLALAAATLPALRAAYADPARLLREV